MQDSFKQEGIYMNKLKKTYRCPIALTNTAKEKMRELGLEEQSFFLLEKSFHIYIEKYPKSSEGIPSVALFLDYKSNPHLAKVCKEYVVVLHCIVKQDRFIATNLTTRAAHIPLDSNWRRQVEFNFVLNVPRNEQVSLELLDLIHNMPIAKESSLYVKKRIASWEGYLKIQERSADIPDMTSRYTRLIYNDDFSRVTITGIQLNEKEWKSLKDLSVKLKGIDKDIGKVLKARQSAGTVEVELHGYMEEVARKQKLEIHPKEVVFSNFATLSQVKRLRQGFKQLEFGLAANPELEQLLFENKPPVKPIKKRASLQFHNRLNKFQQEAVIGAMSAEDLYVIQGPPGTGKTTVISEICLQNAKAGLRTLVASQSNLAVDNALGRLLANKDIRILRVGRTESIEEEGKKFIEDNVGQYWKDHTLQEVSSEFEAHKKREIEIESEWIENEEQQERLKEELTLIEAKIEAKQEVEQQYKNAQSLIDQDKKELQAAEQEKRKVQLHIEEIQQSLHLLKDIIDKDNTILTTEPEILFLQKELEITEEDVVRLQNSVELEELEEEIREQEKMVDQLSVECEKWNEAVKQTDALSERIAGTSKFDSLKWMILEQNLRRTLPVQQLIEDLEAIRREMSQHGKLKDYNEKLNSAISYIEKLLVTQNISIHQLQQTLIQTNSEEVDQFLNKLRIELKGNSAIYPQKLIHFLEGLYGRRNFLWQKAKRLKQYQTYIVKAQDALYQLKQELLSQLLQLQHEHNILLQQKKRELDEQTYKLALLQDKAKQMPQIEMIPQARNLLRDKERKANELKEKIKQLEQTKIRVEANSQKLAEKSLLLEEEKENHTQLEARIEELYKMLREKEEQLGPLEKVLNTEPELEQEEILRKLASISFTREKLKQERQKLPLFQSIQGKWLSLLGEATEHDLNEIRKLYVKHANVIGTTCVASARKDFIESYPVFDVVIIDEVSKATPPELLLPMLKGKKIILVGDHHQLPPLLGDDTLEETLQELAEDNGDFEGKTELKQLLKESLFERLFKNLPKSNKTMLAIQYRMHESIMETISPFYEQENEKLQCGLTDSDIERDHLLESPIILRNNHLLWLDTPNEPAFFEERMKGGKSLYNPAELQRIGVLLKELDEAAAQAKENGRMGDYEKKSIGVISFYGEQVKRIDRMIQQELRLPHLTIRTGTVDRFQGMEMDVILLSMVRNHDNKHDDIGFAKDYRRLNVALSRARELLVLIGSSTMFTERTKHKEVRIMYKHVLEVVKNQDGLRALEEVNLHG